MFFLQQETFFLPQDKIIVLRMKFLRGEFIFSL